MKKIILLIMIMFGFFSFLSAQNETNVQALEELSDEFNLQFQQKKAEALEYARQNNIPVIIELDDSYAEIQYILDGRPQYYTTHNANASTSISTDQVYPGGGASLSLTGSSQTLREWDAGGVLLTHQEYNGRVVQVDAPGSLHYHATHVAGTMIASGFVPAAKGMAYAGSLRAFDWNNDNAEMASEAANGALISNHSYGFIRGWYGSSWYGDPAVSTQEDYRFGFYDQNSANWDQIAWDAPYYLITKSAGNDRNDCDPDPNNPPNYPCDGGVDGYDCIGQQGVAKNIMTVAAVYDVSGGYSGPGSVTMTSFSSWGPADDGRIKPDISANGVSLYSTDKDNNSDYLSLSGTSMSSPSVAGSMALLQEHYENLNGIGVFMRSATLKGLVIHTADECGSNDGPDYEFGWGLMNTESAALLISDNQYTNLIEEKTLYSGGTYNRNVVAQGDGPLQVSMVWTDPPGTPTAPQLDPSTPMLVNDLDLNIAIGSTTHYPWQLDRTNPSSAATNSAENDVDNVEVVQVASPTAGGTYTINVSHDGALSGGSQDYSLIISGIVPTNNYVNGETIGSGQSDCWNATTKIIVANSSNVNINNGGSATFVSGDLVVFHPGFTASSGSEISAKITASNNYCDNL